MCLYLLLNSCTFGIHIRKWYNYLNTIYCVNCVKQGGIISPISFNIYMDNLSIALSNSGIAGYLGGAL